MNQIDTTTYIQPGQTEFGDSSMVYAEIDLKSGAYARRIVNILEQKNTSDGVFLLPGNEVSTWKILNRRMQSKLGIRLFM